MVMSCNTHTCDISYFVNFVTKRRLGTPFACKIPDKRPDFAGSAAAPGQGHACGFRKETVCRPPLPADPPAIGAVADPDRRRPRNLAELHQSDRAEPAPGHGANPVAPCGNL